MYRYTYVMNNLLIFTDPTGYRPDRIFEEEEKLNQIRGSKNNFNYFGWIRNGTDYMQNYITSMSWSYSNGYHHNFHTGAGFFSSPENTVNATKELGGSYDRYTIFETGTSLDGGKTFVGNGNFGVIREGIMVSTGMFSTFHSYDAAIAYVNNIRQEDIWYHKTKSSTNLATLLLSYFGKVSESDILKLNPRVDFTQPIPKNSIIRVPGPTITQVGYYIPNLGPDNDLIRALMRHPHSPIHHSMLPGELNQNQVYYNDELGYFEWNWANEAQTKMNVRNFLTYVYHNNTWRGIYEISSGYYNRAGFRYLEN